MLRVLASAGGRRMNSAVGLDRLPFAFTLTFHYIFPQLTMGLALLIVVLKVLALAERNELYRDAARFWMRIFEVNFAMGVVTGIPMEFRFGTNWAAFSETARGVIGQTLAMEGVISFFIGSSLVGLFLYAEKRLGPRLHLARPPWASLGIAAVGILRHRHRCVDATPRRYLVGSAGNIALGRAFRGGSLKTIRPTTNCDWDCRGYVACLRLQTSITRGQ
jgi:hypothetical protein